MDRASHYLAVDVGASNGRVSLGRWDGARFDVSEIHRFENGPAAVRGHLYWDVLRLWAEIKAGISRHVSRARGRLSGLGIDTWGVDFALLDRHGRLLGNPYHYRDPRTEGMMDLALARVPRDEIYSLTGIQFLQFNTVFQLFSMVRSGDPQLEAADLLLPIPNLFIYWLSGERVAEYTHATTTQCLKVRERVWATGLLDRLQIPSRVFPPIVDAGTVLGPLAADVGDELGLHEPVHVIAVGCHDTASAVAAVPHLDADSAYISSGTWSLMGIEAVAPLVTERSLEGGLTNEGGVAGTIRLLKNIAGLWLVQECRRIWQRNGFVYSWDDLLAAADQAEPFRCVVDPDAPEFLSPPDMPAAIHDACVRTGQPPPQTVGAIVRCCLESLAVRYRATLDDLQGLLGRRLETVHIVGGGSQNRLLCQLTADACQRPVVAGPAEAAALGNLMLQAVATGELADVRQGRAAIASSVSLESYEPRPGAAWDEALARLRRLEAGAGR
ncbi:MAG: FGGY-family carbohydrate kinase [Chloroflexota bacterium]|nr:FGGY-family carbohydrate kinase [Chloroflexota bacterium]